VTALHLCFFGGGRHSLPCSSGTFIMKIWDDFIHCFLVLTDPGTQINDCSICGICVIYPGFHVYMSYVFVKNTTHP